MYYRVLGKSDLNVSEISLGCMSLGTNTAKAIEIINTSVDFGINYFDTADLYQNGLNESILGAALKGKRHQNYIATKVGNQWVDANNWIWNPTAKHILSAVELSLQRLQTDYIDLYQLHGGTLEDPIDEIIETFESLKRSGKIRYYGISSIRPLVIEEYLKRSSIVSVMMQYSLLDRRPEGELLQLLGDNNIAMLARGSLAKGLLAGKPPANYLEHSAASVDSVQKSMLQIGSDHVSVAQAYVLSHDAVSTAVTGVSNLEQLKSNVLHPIVHLTDLQKQALQNSVKKYNY